jgi:hypothetical protein
MSHFLTKQQLGILRVVSRQFFAQMDRDCLKNATQQLLTFCSEHGPLPNAAKDVSFLIEGLVYADPATVLPSIFPALLENLVVKRKSYHSYDAKGDVEKSFLPSSTQVESDADAEAWHLGNLSTRELTWRLRLLRGAVRYGGSALLPFTENLRATLRHTLNHDTASVSDNAAKLLKSMLAGLAETYPLDFRSLPPKEWPRAHSYGALLREPLQTKERGHWASVAVAWHECSENEATLAAALLEEHLLEPLEALACSEEAFSSATASPSDQTARTTTWKNAMRSALACFRGGASLLHDFDSSQGDDEAQGLSTGSAASRYSIPQLKGMRQRAVAAANVAHTMLWGTESNEGRGFGPSQAIIAEEWIKVRYKNTISCN